ncbi:hypothetical protein QJQ45_009687 [Haematococcus lacustris]|nr:hypothetical protein QJQ45_009687 [Haematococcus lacustris]
MACGYGINAKSLELKVATLDKGHVADLVEEANTHRRLLGIKKQGSLQDTLPLPCHMRHAVHVCRWLEQWQQPHTPPVPGQPKRGKRRGDGPRTLTCPPSFTLTPMARVGVHFIKVDSRVLHGVCRQLGLTKETRAAFTSEPALSHHWARWFDTIKLRNKEFAFERTVDTDGVSVCVHYTRPLPPPPAPPPAASSSTSSRPSAAAAAAHAVGLPHIGRGIAETREYVFDPDTQIGVGIDPGVTQAVSAASGVWDPQSGQLMADQLRRWKLTKGQVKHASGLNNARRDTERWLAPIKPHLQHLAAASSAGTSLEANLKHITVTLATWDAVWEVYLDPKWARQRLRLYGAQDRALEQFFKKLEEDMAEVSMERHGHAKQLVVFFGAASIGTAGGWGADAVLRACRKVVCRPRGTDQRRGRVVLVDEHRTTRVSSAVNGKQPCEEELNTLSATRPAGWKPPAGQVEQRLLRPAWSQQRDHPVRGMMWCPVVPPCKPPQAPRSSQAATPTAASEPGPSTPPPAKRSKPAAEPTKGKGKGKAAKAKPAPQPGRWLDRDCNAALNMQRIGESRWRPLELCYWPDQGALPAKGKEYPGLGYKRLRDEPPKAQQQQQPAEAQIGPAKSNIAGRELVDVLSATGLVATTGRGHGDMGQRTCRASTRTEHIIMSEAVYSLSHTFPFPDACHEFDHSPITLSFKAPAQATTPIHTCNADCHTGPQFQWKPDHAARYVGALIALEEEVMAVKQAVEQGTHSDSINRFVHDMTSYHGLRAVRGCSSQGSAHWHVLTCTPQHPPAYELPHLDNITSIVQAQLRELNNDTAPGLDGLPAPFIKHARTVDEGVTTYLMLPLLATWFHSMMRTVSIPAAWKVARISPLFKDTDPTDPNKYRMLAVSSVLYRLYANVLRHVLTAWCMAHKVLPAEQFGFIPGRSTMQPMFILRHLVHAQKASVDAKHRKLFTAFIDFKQAYDHIPRQQLWEHLRVGVKLPQPLLACLEGLYRDDSYVLIDGPHRTPQVTPDQGVKQGCPISPLLFALYVHDISKEFLGPVDAVRVQGTPVTHFMYADDLTLVSTSPHGLQGLICQLQGFADRKHLTVNVDKSKVMVFKGNSQTAAPSIVYKHEILPVVREFKYLGMHFNPSATLAFAATQMRVGMLLAMRQACKRAKEYGVLHDPYTLCHLIRAFVLPLGLYGSEVWGTAFLGHGVQLSNPVQTRMLSFLRFAARVRSSVSGLMMLHELGQLPLQLYWLRAAGTF